MGYRSEVKIAITKKARTALLVANKNFSDETRKYSQMEECEDGMLVYHFGDVKWYEDYPEVQQDMAVLDYLDEIEYEDEYGFIRMGEELGDWEQRGNHEFFYPTQGIECGY